MDTMLGNAELGQLLGVSRQRVSQIVSSAEFPAPRLTLAMGSIWALVDVLKWADSKSRSVDDDVVQALRQSQPRGKSKS